MNLSKRIWSNERRNKKFKNLIKFWSIYKTIYKTIVSLFVEKIRKLNPKVTKKKQKRTNNASIKMCSAWK